MRINKLFGARSITNLLYGLIMFLPFMAILGRVIYTQSNPNAKDSYTGSVSYLATQNIDTYLTTSERTTISELTTNSVVHYKANNTNLSGEYQSISHRLFQSGTVWSFNVINVADLYIDNALQSNVKSIVLFRNSSSVRVYLNTFDYYYNFDSFYVAINPLNSENTNYLNESGNIVYSSSASYRLIYNNVNQNIDVSFVNIEQNIYYQVDTSMLKNFEKNIFYTESTLSNAFEYSLDMFVNNNANLNNINFFGWFDGFFLNQSNTHNLLYLNFANWYMNYALLVSSGYLLFLALMWFINYVRRILDKSQNIDFGGF